MGNAGKDDKCSANFLWVNNGFKINRESVFCRFRQMDNTSADKPAKCKHINSKADKSHWIKLWITRSDSVDKWKEELIWCGNEGRQRRAWLFPGWRQDESVQRTEEKQWRRTRGHNCYSAACMKSEWFCSFHTSLPCPHSPHLFKAYCIKEQEHILQSTYPCTVTITTSGVITVVSLPCTLTHFVLRLTASHCVTLHPDSSKIKSKMPRDTDYVSSMFTHTVQQSTEAVGTFY